MKSLIFTFLLAISFNASSQKIGYIITINNKKSIETKFFKTQSNEIVQKSIFINTGLDLDIERIFEGDNEFFKYENNRLIYYCERKIVERKNNGKIIYRKIKRKDRNELINYDQVVVEKTVF